MCDAARELHDSKTCRVAATYVNGRLVPLNRPLKVRTALRWVHFCGVCSACRVRRRETARVVCIFRASPGHGGSSLLLLIACFRLVDDAARGFQLHQGAPPANGAWCLFWLKQTLHERGDASRNVDLTTSPLFVLRVAVESAAQAPPPHASFPLTAPPLSSNTPV